MSGNDLWDALNALSAGDTEAWCEFVAASPVIPDAERGRLIEAWRNKVVKALSPAAARRVKKHAEFVEFDAERKRLTAEGVRGEERTAKLVEMFQHRLSDVGCHADIERTLVHQSLRQMLHER